MLTILAYQASAGFQETQETAVIQASPVRETVVIVASVEPQEKPVQADTAAPAGLVELSAALARVDIAEQAGLERAVIAELVVLQALRAQVAIVVKADTLARVRIAVNPPTAGKAARVDTQGKGFLDTVASQDRVLTAERLVKVPIAALQARVPTAAFPAKVDIQDRVLIVERLARVPIVAFQVQAATLARVPTVDKAGRAD